MDKVELRRTYDRLAPWFDLLEGVPELVFRLRRRRRRLLSRARGRILEVAAGTGKNLRHYPPGLAVTAVDLSPGMLARAREKAAAGDHEGDVRFAVMDGEALGFGDGTFDTVVDSLTLCTYPAPLTALREMARVCAEDGRLLFLEHGRSEVGWLGRLQDRHADRLADAVGCHWNREPLELLRGAGLSVQWEESDRLGVFRAVEARPG